MLAGLHRLKPVANAGRLKPALGQAISGDRMVEGRPRPALPGAASPSCWQQLKAGQGHALPRGGTCGAAGGCLSRSCGPIIIVASRRARDAGRVLAVEHADACAVCSRWWLWAHSLKGTVHVPESPVAGRVG